MGLVVQGSIPWAIFVLFVFVHLVLTHLITKWFKQEVYMELKKCFNLFLISLLETIWTLEANVVAAALPA